MWFIRISIYISLWFIMSQFISIDTRNLIEKSKQNIIEIYQKNAIDEESMSGAMDVFVY